MAMRVPDPDRPDEFANATDHELLVEIVRQVRGVKRLIAVVIVVQVVAGLLIYAAADATG